MNADQAQPLSPQMVGILRSLDAAERGERTAANVDQHYMVEPRSQRSASALVRRGFAVAHDSAEGCYRITDAGRRVLGTYERITGAAA